MTVDPYYIDFLVSVLMKYPQIFAIKYSNTLKSYVFSFMYQGDLRGEQFESLKDKIISCFSVYEELNQCCKINLSFKKIPYKKSTFIEINVNGDSLCSQDINLLASIMVVELGDEIISDQDEIILNHYSSEDPEEREVEYLSREGLQNQNKENLIVFRDAGKVYVFDK